MSKMNLSYFFYQLGTLLPLPSGEKEVSHIVAKLHTCSQTSSLVQVCVLIFCGQKLGHNQIWQNFLYHSTDYFLSNYHEISHVFTNIISIRSSRFDLLQSKTRSTSNLTDFSFLFRLSRNFTHVFTNIISCTSSRFDLLWSKTSSTSNLTDLTDFFFYFLSDCHETSHSCSQTSLVRAHVLTSCSQKLGQHQIWRILSLVQLSRNFTHVFTNIIYCTSSRFDLMRS